MASLDVEAASVRTNYCARDITASPESTPRGCMFVRYKGVDKIFVWHSEKAFSNRMKRRNDMFEWCAQNASYAFRRLRYKGRGLFIMRGIKAIHILRSMCEGALPAARFNDNGKKNYDDIFTCIKEKYPKTHQARIFDYIHLDKDMGFVWNAVNGPVLWHICLENVAIPSISVMMRVITTGDVRRTMLEHNTRLSLDAFTIIEPIPGVTNMQKLIKRVSGDMCAGAATPQPPAPSPSEPVQKAPKKRAPAQGPKNAMPTEQVRASPAAKQSSLDSMFVVRQKQPAQCEQPETCGADAQQNHTTTGAVNVPVNDIPVAVCNIQDVDVAKGAADSDDGTGSGSGDVSDSDSSSDEDDEILLSSDDENDTEMAAWDRPGVYMPIEDDEPVCGVKTCVDKLYTTCKIAVMQASSKTHASVGGAAVDTFDHAEDLKNELSYVSTRKTFVAAQMRALKRKYSMWHQECLLLEQYESELRTESEDLDKLIRTQDVTENSVFAEKMNKRRQLGVKKPTSTFTQNVVQQIV